MPDNGTPIMGVAVGIDLGTTNTVVACVRDGRAVTLPDEEGRRLIPSIVSFHPNGSVLVGESAKDRRLIDPANTVYSVKRLIGRSWASDEVQQARGRFPFELREGAKNSTLVVGRGETYALPEISAFVLRRAKAIAERALGETVDRAVITVPANFNDLQRASTKVAGKLAGLEVLRILNEPTAAALAYGQTTSQNERLAVYDLGGGTFDITLLDLSGNVFEVLATAGRHGARRRRHRPRHRRHHGRPDRPHAPLRPARRRDRVRASSHLRRAAEAATVLARPRRASRSPTSGWAKGARSVTITFKMTREELERETEGMIDRTLDVCRFAIETVNLTVADVDRVIMVGGPTRMPLIQRRVQNFFAKPPALKVNPDEVVALGAAIQAHVLDRGRKTKGATKAPTAMDPPPAEEAIPRISAKATQAPARPAAMFPLGDNEITATNVPAPAPPVTAAPPAAPPLEPAVRAQRIVALGGMFPPHPPLRRLPPRLPLSLPLHSPLRRLEPSRRTSSTSRSRTPRRARRRRRRSPSPGAPPSSRSTTPARPSA